MYVYSNLRRRRTIEFFFCSWELEYHNRTETDQFYVIVMRREEGLSGIVPFHVE
jgi:hypothetical protein